MGTMKKKPLLSVTCSNSIIGNSTPLRMQQHTLHSPTSVLDMVPSTTTTTTTSGMARRSSTRKRTRVSLFSSSSWDNNSNNHNNIEIDTKPDLVTSSFAASKAVAPPTAIAKSSRPRRQKSKSTAQQTSTSSSSFSPPLCASELALVSPHNRWIDLRVPPEELRASATLTTGQCFHWIPVVANDDDDDDDGVTSAWGTHDATEWVGAFGPYDHVLSVRETATTTLYRVLVGDGRVVDARLRAYFQLDVPLAPLYADWAARDPPRLGRLAPLLPGVRVLRQDPWECLVAFLCSSNNNIPRITLILRRLRARYGVRLLRLRDDDDGRHDLYSFPTPEALRHATEEELRTLGLGYRAKYLIKTRDLLDARGGGPFLEGLRSHDRYSDREVQTELVKFHGVGRKVADCVALFSLDRPDVVPVDVHVWNIAVRDYGFGSASDDDNDDYQPKTLTPRLYDKVGELWRGIFPQRVGWAHSVLFVAELPSFARVLPPDMVAHMAKWKKEESAKKLAAKAEMKAKKNTI